jgi:outer membrane immunogenic protein
MQQYFMDLHRNFQSAEFSNFAGNAKESSAWAVGARIGYMVTPNVFTYWNGGYTQTHFDQINLTDIFCACASATIGSHTYSGWFLGGGRKSHYRDFSAFRCRPGCSGAANRYSSFNSATLPITDIRGIALVSGTQFSENMKPYVQTITTSLVWKFNWNGY